MAKESGTEVARKSSWQHIIGMLTNAERDFLLDFCKNRYCGTGEIVDLGCFMGSSTIPMAVGLSENSNVVEKEQRIHAYDRFVWEDWMNNTTRGTRLEGKFQSGDSFLDEFKLQMGARESYIETHPGDLTKIGWELNSPIEYLFVDAMKNWELCNCIVRNFYPNLVPEVSYLHHQDYVHFHTYWIHLVSFRMKDFFEPVDHGYLSASRVFRYTRLMPDDLTQTAYSLDMFDEHEIDAAFEYSSSIIAEAGQPNISAARIRVMIDKGEIDRARSAHKSAIEKFGVAGERSELRRIPVVLERMGC